MLALNLDWYCKEKRGLTHVVIPSCSGLCKRDSLSRSEVSEGICRNSMLRTRLPDLCKAVKPEAHGMESRQTRTVGSLRTSGV